MYVMGYSARILRSEPHCHDVDGVCRWLLVIPRVTERFPTIDPKFTAKQWLEQFVGDRKESLLRLAIIRMATTLQHLFFVFKITARDQLGSNTLKGTTAQVMIHLCWLQWRKGRSRGHAGTLGQASHDHHTAKHHFQKAQKNNSEGCADRLTKDADGS